jgi:glycosyltransferase involved in cell wall biosynthesis
MKNDYNVAIIGWNFSFPFGHAAAQRVRLLARAMQHANMTVRVVQVGPLLPGEEASQLPLAGEYSGVPYIIIADQPVPHPSRIRRQLGTIRSILLNHVKLLHQSKQPSIDCAYLYGSGRLALTAALALQCKLMGIPVVLEMTEWLPGSANWTRTRSFLLFEVLLRLIDGLVVISHDLESRFHAERHARNLSFPITRIPILVDTEEWPPRPREQSVAPSFLWSGDVTGYLTSVLPLLKALSKLHGRHPAAALHILGHVSEQTRKQIRQHQTDLRLPKDTVILHGYVSKEKLHQLYSEAFAFLVPLQDTAKDQARFPTKIGEYLSCGHPVIATGVGEFSRYAQDGVNAFLFPPGSVDDLASIMNRLLDTKGLVRQVGAAGRVLAQTHFDFRSHGGVLRQLISDICDG